MIHLRSSWILHAVIVLIASQSHVHAQGILRGVVSDSGGTPLAGAMVDIAQLKRTTATDAKGTFEFTDVPSGRYRIQARSVGYQPRALNVRVRSTEALRLIFQLAPVPVVLDSLSVEVPAPEAYNPLMGEFKDRRRSQPGHFLGPAELKELEQSDLPMVLQRFHIPIRRQKVTNRPFAAARAGRTLSHDDICPVQVFLDGALLSNVLDTFDISSLRIQNLAGLEYYEGLSRIPIQFDRGDSRCGVLVLWTRIRNPDQGRPPPGVDR